jgi:7-cyano-7-deazaguanine reductase
MNENPLGKKRPFPKTYNKDLLFFIPRKKNDISDISKVDGYDLWNCYEFSYLDSYGKPINKLLRIKYSASSPNIVESKSLKLYLASFSMTRFDTHPIDTIKNDLKNGLQSDVEIKLFDCFDFFSYTNIEKDKFIDDIVVDINEYSFDSNLLKIIKNDNDKEEIDEIDEIYSNLLKTNCPITDQPDWATLYISYKSKNRIDKVSLIKYIVSFRNHNDYHENVCERIFYDLYKILQPTWLVVNAYFTRRGGIEINPHRFYGMESKYNDVHFWRQ